VMLALTAGHIVLILLGVLSASVQSIRLHYYETFSKFFIGRGVKFIPFGSARVYTRA
jgi:V/A-type H+-transporting ATPase subunit I